MGVKRSDCQVDFAFLLLNGLRHVVPCVCDRHPSSLEGCIGCRVTEFVEQHSVSELYPVQSERAALEAAAKRKKEADAEAAKRAAAEAQAAAAAAAASAAAEAAAAAAAAQAEAPPAAPAAEAPPLIGPPGHARAIHMHRASRPWAQSRTY